MAWVRDSGRTAMSREAKSQKSTVAAPVGADSVAWVRDSGRTAMSREAKSQKSTVAAPVGADSAARGEGPGPVPR